MNALQAFKKIITEDLELYNLIGECERWPKIPEEGYDSTEDLDLENVEVIELSEEKVVIWGGGDWQQPHKVTLEMVGGRLTATSCENGGHYNDHKFLTWQQLEETLEQVP